VPFFNLNYSMSCKIPFAAAALALCLPLQAMAGNSPPNSAGREAEAHGHEKGILSGPGMTGAWGGARDRLKDSGITLAAIYAGEFVRNFDPGLVDKREETVYEDNLDLTATIDTGKAGLWSGGTFFVYGLFNHGGDSTAGVIGDLQGISNIEGPDRFIVQEAWYQQQFVEGRISVLAGLYDLNSEFYVTDYGSLFLNSSPGVGPEISVNVPASIFPKAGLGVRARAEPVNGWYIQAAGFDGNPGTRRLSSSEGKMAIVESGLNYGKGNYKFGYWLHTADKTFNGQTFREDYGVYGIVDQGLFSFGDDGSVGAFMQWGWVPQRRNEITKYYGGGLRVHGLVPTRHKDDLGIAVARAFTHTATESTIELTYRLVLTPWLAVQPSLQWIVNPGGNAAASSIKAGLLRFEAAL